MHAHQYQLMMYVQTEPWPHYDWQRKASATRADLWPYRLYLKEALHSAEQFGSAGGRMT